MGSKYAHLRGSIPEEPSERDQAFLDAKAMRAEMSLAQLTEDFNATSVVAAEQAAALKITKANLDVIETLIRQKVDADSADAITMNGYTWTPTVEPIANVRAASRPALIDHLIEHGMRDMLSVADGRLKSFIKEEAENNDLIVEPITKPDGTEGVEVRSTLPGVLVYLRPALSRVKSSKGAK